MERREVAACVVHPGVGQLRDLLTSELPLGSEGRGAHGLLAGRIFTVVAHFDRFAGIQSGDFVTALHNRPVGEA